MVEDYFEITCNAGQWYGDKEVIASEERTIPLLYMKDVDDWGLGSN